MPAIAKILIVFAGVLFVSRLRTPLGLALVLGGVVLNLWAGVGVPQSLLNLLHAVGAPDVWLLLLLVCGIVEFGRYMTEEDNAQAIMSAVRRWGGRHGRAFSLIVLPAVVGLVPMPGGALFSAPMVEKTTEFTRRPPEWKAASNYWFRHVWEYWWPLYPGVLVAMSIMSVKSWQFFAVQFPFSLVSLAAGYFVLVRPHLSSLAEEHVPGSGGGMMAGVRLLLPLGLVIVSVFGLEGVYGHCLPSVSTRIIKMLAMLTGLVTGLIVIAIEDYRAGRGLRLFRSLGTRKSQAILLLIIGVMVFSHLVTRSGLIEETGRQMQNSRFSLGVIVAFLPFAAGMVTGIAVAFVGAAFPFVVALLDVSPTLGALSGLVLAYGFGYMGMMLSPVHLCLLLSNEHFESDLGRVYRTYAPCVVIVMIYTLVAAYGLQHFGL